MILECCGFSERTWFQILKLWCETGFVTRPSSTCCSRLQILDTDNIQYLLRLVRNDPNYFLDEFLSLLQKNRFISVHYTTIFHELERAGMSCKKLKCIAIE